MSKKKKKVIVFDGDGTVYQFKESFGISYSRILKEFSIIIDPKELDLAILNVWNDFQGKGHLSGADRDYQFSEEENKRFWQLFVETILEHFGHQSQEEIYQALHAHYAQPESRILSPFMKEVLLELKKRKYKLGIVSNYDNRFQNIVDGLGLSGLVDFAYDSCEIGYRKPSEKIFNIVSQKENFHAKEAVYVGDELKNDYHAPRSAGWHSIIYNLNRTAIEEDGIEEINCMKELLEKL